MFRFNGGTHLAFQLNAHDDHASLGPDDSVAHTSPSATASEGAVDLIKGDTHTTATLAIGGAETGIVNTPGDDDWFKVALVAGESYVFLASGDGASPVEDTYLELRGSTGALIAIDDDGGAGANSLLRFTCTQSGTYFLNARAWEDDAGASLTGGYQVSAAIGPAQDPLDTIDWGTQVGDLHVSFYFAKTSDAGLHATENWDILGKNAARNALATFATVTGLTFNEVNNRNAADFVFVLNDKIGADVLGQMQTPGATPHAQVGSFNPDASSWSAGGLAPGGLGWATLIHEFGHGLGLAHPHDNGGRSEIMQGVLQEFRSYGTYNLNRGVFTMMTYNDGAGALARGLQATPMALDIAVLQEKYGVNAGAGAGNTTYTIPSTAAGVLSCIWDASGVDTIRGVGSIAYTIDLRAATLLSEIGGGGFISKGSGGAWGGFTIAGGVVIERAIGAAGADTLIGNSGGNTLTGNAGADTISGGLGNDLLNGGLGADTLKGGDGADTVTYANSSIAVSVNLNSGIGSGGDAAGDKLSLIENVIGSAFDDLLTGSTSNNALTGGAGADEIRSGAGSDVINGGLGADVLTGNAGADTFVFNAALTSVDTITDFSAPVDTIQIDHAVFSGLGVGALDAGAFNTGASAAEADDRIIYDPATGALYFDPDGSDTGQTQVQFAQLTVGLALTSADFLVA